LEREQKRRREVKGKEGSSRRSSKTGVKTKLAMILSMAKETKASAGNNGACSNGRS